MRVGGHREEVDVAVARLVAGIEPVRIELGAVIGPKLERGVHFRIFAPAFGRYRTHEGYENRLGQARLAGGFRIVRRIFPNDRIVVILALIGHVDQGAEFAGRRHPAVGDQDIAIRIDLVDNGRVGTGHRARHLQALEVEWPVHLDIDETGNAAFDLVGRARLVDIQTGQHFRRHVLEVVDASAGREDLVAVQCRLDIGQAADVDADDLVVVAGDLDAGDALQRVAHRQIRQLADVFRNDRIDDVG